MTDNFCFDTRHTLSGAGFRYIPLHTAGLCSDMQLSYWELVEASI